RHERRPAVPGTGDVDHVEAVLDDRAIEVRVNEVLARRRPPVSEQARLDVRRPERFAEQRVVEQIDLPDGQVVRRAPVRVETAEEFSGSRHASYLPRRRDTSRAQSSTLRPLESLGSWRGSSLAR